MTLDNNDLIELLYLIDNWNTMTENELLDCYNNIKHLQGLSDDFNLFLEGLYDYSQNKIGYGVMGNFITVAWLEVRDLYDNSNG